MILRVLLAALAIWGMTWSKDASAIYMVKTCQTVLVGWDGYEAIYEERCRYENWEGGGDFYDPDPGYGGGGGGGGNYSQTCQSIRGDRPENCGNSDPGNPADFPYSESATLVFNPWIGVPSDLRQAFDHFFGCVGGGHNSVQGCADEIYRETYPTCTYQNCFMFTDDLLLVMGTQYIDDYVRDSITWSIAWPAQIGATPDFDMFPEWVKELVTRARAQMDCHNWHDRMQAAGCSP